MARPFAGAVLLLRVGFMPGNPPEFMGVLLLDRRALGPSAASTAAGFAYHFWNGAAFGAAFAMLPLARGWPLGSDSSPVL